MFLHWFIFLRTYSFGNTEKLEQVAPSKLPLQPLHGFYFFRFCKSSWWWFQPTNSWSQLSWVEHLPGANACQCYPVHHLSGTTYSFRHFHSSHICESPRCWRQFYSSICHQWKTPVVALSLNIQTSNVVGLAGSLESEAPRNFDHIYMFAKLGDLQVCRLQKNIYFLRRHVQDLHGFMIYYSSYYLNPFIPQCPSPQKIAACDDELSLATGV